MGGLKLLVTGATGFLGRHVVAEAVARGHAVRGLARSGTVDGAETVPGDLSAGLPASALDGVDAVIHCAGALSGDAAAQARDTVGATLALLDAVQGHPARLVLAGSLSVLGAVPPGDVVDEATPVERTPRLRDAYARAKIAQEGAVLAEARASGRASRVMRIGALFGPERLRNGHLGIGLGPLLLSTGGAGEVPVAWVEHAALALVLAAETPQGPAIVHVVDDDRPDRARYLRALRRGGWPRAVLPIGWRLPDAVAGAMASLGQARRMPGLLRRPTLRARMAPARYANDRLHALGWAPRKNFDEAMAASMTGDGG